MEPSLSSSERRNPPFPWTDRARSFGHATTRSCRRSSEEEMLPSRTTPPLHCRPRNLEHAKSSPLLWSTRLTADSSLFAVTTNTSSTLHWHGETRLSVAHWTL